MPDPPPGRPAVRLAPGAALQRLQVLGQAQLEAGVEWLMASAVEELVEAGILGSSPPHRPAKPISLNVQLVCQKGH